MPKNKIHFRLIMLVMTLAPLLLSCKPSQNVGWRELPNRTAFPLPGANHGTVAYDTLTHQALFFGGQMDGNWSDETWIWDGEKWSQRRPLTSPPAREKQALAYDQARQQFVIFGGAFNDTTFDDTWVWNGETWEHKNPEHIPPARCCHDMAYDKARQRVVLYGGWNGSTFFNDTWEWDGTDWQDVTCCDSPEIAAHRLAYFEPSQAVIAVLPQYGTWQWDGQQWQDLAIPGPPSRADGRLVYDEKQKLLIFFGGNKDGQLLSDVWTFNGSHWSELTLPNMPSARFGHMMFYDGLNDRIILFGGAGEDGRRNDTWELILPDELMSQN